jgi:hypothetical protein
MLQIIAKDVLSDSEAPQSRTMRFTLFSASYSSMALKGSVSHQHAINPSDYERANYLQVLDSYSEVSGVWQ